MSIFKKDTIIKQFPAVAIVKREPDYNGAINVTYDEQFTTGNMVGAWYFGSVASYSLENNKCPYKAAEHAKKNGHKLYWISSCATCISDSPQQLPNRILLTEDDVIRFEGHYFKIKPAANNNYSLVPVEPPSR